MATLLARVLPGFLEVDPRRVILLIGRGGDSFAKNFVDRHPALSSRLFALGELNPGDLSRHLQACDLMVQPYSDRVCGRRSTYTAALSHEIATASIAGPNTPACIRGSLAEVLVGDGDRSTSARLASPFFNNRPSRNLLATARPVLYRLKSLPENDLQ